MSNVIFKMTFKHPNLPDSVGKNVSHVEYIATRPGTDKTLSESDLMNELNKGVVTMSEDDDYMKYIDARPRSQGLFGPEGAEDYKVVQNELSNVDRFVWRSIISIKEENAINLGYLSKEKWQDMLRSKIPDMAKEIGIRPTNLKWVAAVHMEKGHPHAHVMLWEKSAEKTMGVINVKSLDKIRKILTDEIFEDERIAFLNEKNATRDVIKDLAIKDLSEMIRFIKEEGGQLSKIVDDHAPGIQPRLYEDDEVFLFNKLKSLSEVLPKEGRLNYAFMQPDIKARIDEISEFLINRPGIIASVEKNANAVEQLTKMYTGKEEAIQKAKENAHEDLRNRLRGIVLKGASELATDNIFKVDQELSCKAVRTFESLTKKINLTEEYSAVAASIASVLLKTEHDANEIKQIISSYLENEGLKLNSHLLSDIVEKTKTNHKNEGADSFLDSPKKNDQLLSCLKIAGYSDQEAYSKLMNVITVEVDGLKKRLEEMRGNGILKVVSGEYKLTNVGIAEFLKGKRLTSQEKNLMTYIDKRLEQFGSVTTEDLLADESLLKNFSKNIKSPFVLSKFDEIIKSHFNKSPLTIQQLEKKIFENHSLKLSATFFDQPEDELFAIKNRIEKLCHQGLMHFDKLTQEYSLDKSKWNQETLNDPFKMTRYDATKIMSYFDRLQGEFLDERALRKFIVFDIKAAIEEKKAYLENSADKEQQHIDDNKTQKTIDKQLGNVLRRLKSLEMKGYLKFDGVGYLLTNHGNSERLDLISPSRVVLKTKLNYLSRLGLITKEDEQLTLTSKYETLVKDIALAREKGVIRTSDRIPHDLHYLIDKAQDTIDMDEIRADNERVARAKYYKDEFNQTKKDYSFIRSSSSVVDLTHKTMVNFSKMLLQSGCNPETALVKLTSWNTRTSSGINESDLQIALAKAIKEVGESKLWHKISTINKLDWNEMFKVAGLKENETPTWMYKGENWKSYNTIYSTINNLWKSTFREIEKQKMQNEAAALSMLNQLNKQNALENKSAAKEMARKSKDKSAIYKDEDDLER